MSTNDKQIEKAQDRQAGEGVIAFRDVAPMAEICCWTVVTLAPILRWVNGPAVTTDQFVVQVVMVGGALAGAIGLRVYNWQRGRAIISRQK
jgi:hypothetical protein